VIFPENVYAVLATRFLLIVPVRRIVFWLPAARAQISIEVGMPVTKVGTVSKILTPLAVLYQLFV